MLQKKKTAKRKVTFWGRKTTPANKEVWRNIMRPLAASAKKTNLVY